MLTRVFRSSNEEELDLMDKKWHFGLRCLNSTEERTEEDSKFIRFKCPGHCRAVSSNSE